MLGSVTRTSVAVRPLFASGKQERKRLQVEKAHLKSDRAKILKLADKISNLRDIAANPPCGWSVKRRLDYVRWAREVADGLKVLCIGHNQRKRALVRGKTLRPMPYPRGWGKLPRGISEVWLVPTSSSRPQRMQASHRAAQCLALLRRTPWTRSKHADRRHLIWCIAPHRRFHPPGICGYACTAKPVAGALSQ